MNKQLFFCTLSVTLLVPMAVHSNGSDHSEERREHEHGRHHHHHNHKPEAEVVVNINGQQGKGSEQGGIEAGPLITNTLGIAGGIALAVIGSKQPTQEAQSAFIVGGLLESALCAAAAFNGAGSSSLDRNNTLSVLSTLGAIGSLIATGLVATVADNKAWAAVPALYTLLHINDVWGRVMAANRTK